MTADLKSIVDRVNRLMDERDALTADIRDIYAEAKGRGYIPKALRKVVARMRMDPATLAEDDALLETYEAALGRVGKAMRAVREGATLDEAAEKNGVHRATLARARAVAKQGENATVANHGENATHDPATGEVHESSGEGDNAEVQDLRADAAAGSVSARGQRARRSEGVVQTVHEDAARGQAHEGVATHASGPGEELGAAEIAGCGSERSDCEAGPLREVPAPDAQSCAGRTSLGLHEATASGVAVPVVSRPGAHDVVGGSVGPLDTQPEDTLEIPERLRRVRSAA